MANQEELRAAIEKVASPEPSEVKVHETPETAQIGVPAFTSSSQDLFQASQGQDTTGAYELAHVVQQAKRRVRQR